MEQLITPFIHKKVVVLPQSTSAYTAARAMLEQEIGCILINNHQGKFIGILTDRDLACQLISYGYSGEEDVSEFITADLITVSENSTLSEVITNMIEFGIRRIPVITVDNHNKEKCIGIITLDDLIASKAINMDEVSQIIKKQIKRRSLRYLKNKERKNIASKEQKLNQFYNGMLRFMKLYKTFEKEDAKSIINLILSFLIQRMPATGAAHFICNFPSLLQEKLFDLPAGPNRAITNTFIINEIMKKYQMDQEEAENIFKDFWKGLEHTLDFNKVEHMLKLLPENMRNYSYGAITDIDINLEGKLKIQ